MKLFIATKQGKGEVSFPIEPSLSEDDDQTIWVTSDINRLLTSWHLLCLGKDVQMFTVKASF